MLTVTSNRRYRLVMNLNCSFVNPEGVVSCLAMTRECRHCVTLVVRLLRRANRSSRVRLTPFVRRRSENRLRFAKAKRECRSEGSWVSKSTMQVGVLRL